MEVFTAEKLVTGSSTVQANTSLFTAVDLIMLRSLKVDWCEIGYGAYSYTNYAVVIVPEGMSVGVLYYGSANPLYSQPHYQVMTGLIPHADKAAGPSANHGSDDAEMAVQLYPGDQIYLIDRSSFTDGDGFSVIQVTMTLQG